MRRASMCPPDAVCELTIAHTVIHACVANSSDIFDERRHAVRPPEKDQRLVYEVRAQVIRQACARSRYVFPTIFHRCPIAIISVTQNAASIRACGMEGRTGY